MARRNNEDRVGAKKAASPGPPVAAIQGENNLFNFATPTEFVELPSQGKHYPKDHPLHNQETVEIKYMTAKDEDILSSQALLKKGLAIDRLLSNIIVENAPTDTLLVGDKNAILVAARVTGFGNIYSTNVTCPACGETNKHDFDLSEVNTTMGNPEEVGAELTKEGTFKVVLPQTKVEVEFRLLNGADERHMFLAGEKKKKLKLQDTPIVDTMRLFIVSAAGQSEPGVISQFLDLVPARDARALRAAFQKCTPNVDMKQVYACEGCDHTQEMEVPLTADFFWPDR